MFNSITWISINWIVFEPRHFCLHHNFIILRPHFFSTYRASFPKNIVSHRDLLFTNCCINMFLSFVAWHLFNQLFSNIFNFCCTSAPRHGVCLSYNVAEYVQHFFLLGPDPAPVQAFRNRSILSLISQLSKLQTST